MIPLVVLAAVFLLIAIRQVGSVRLHIWQVMLGGALAVVGTGQIAPRDAVRAINLDVLVFLFFMFVVGQALEQSGVLESFATRWFGRARSVSGLLLAILFGMGAASALLMNDTVAIVGTPVVLMLAGAHRLRPVLLLLTLAFSITLGSVVSPIGNPQNLLIAMNGVPNPFITFPVGLLLPTLLNLLLTFAVLRLFYSRDFRGDLHAMPPRGVGDRPLARLCYCSLAILVGLIGFNIAMFLMAPARALPLPWIAAASALPVLLASSQRWTIVRRSDWGTLVFFGRCSC